MNINKLLNIENSDFCFHNNTLYFASKNHDLIYFLAKFLDGKVNQKIGYSQCIWVGKKAKEIWNILTDN